MTVYLAWTSGDLDDVEGPWHEVRQVAPGLVVVDSTESLSAVYHALKFSLERDAALIVVPVHQTPKSRGMARGTTTWLRRRTGGRPPVRAGGPDPVPPVPGDGARAPR